MIRAERIRHIAHKFRTLECASESRLDPSNWWIMRLDGCGFKGLTRTLEKPFDPRFTRAMISLSESLLERTSAHLSFTQSDEVTLAVCNRDSVNGTQLWAGRVQKLCSIIASFAAVKMAKALEQEGVQGKEPFFDCRVVAVAGASEVAEAFWWRHAGDCRRNAVNMIGFSHFDHSELSGLSLEVVVEKLKVERGVEIGAWGDAPLLGTWSKKKEVAHQGFNPRTGESVMTVRRRVESRTGLNFITPEDLLPLVESDMWADEVRQSAIQG